MDIIESAIGVLRVFGADDTMFKVHINNRRLFNDVIASICGKSAEESKKVSKIVDKKNKIPREVYEKELSELGIDSEKVAKIDALYTMSVQEATALCPDSVGAKELADLLGGMVACTRPLVEANIFDAKHQIGLSGRTVKPKFIICLGISGAVQFAAGMKSSDCIVAINTDESAPIFDVAHYCLVGDVNEIVPELISKIKGDK